MGYYGPDAYNQPEHFGLEIIGYLDDPDACYSYDDLVVWQHEDGRLFWAEDSGCSCPSPFELYTKLAQLTEITSETWADFEQAVKDHCVPYDYDLRKPQYDADTQAADKTQLLSKVARLLR